MPENLKELVIFGGLPGFTIRNITRTYSCHVWPLIRVRYLQLIDYWEVDNVMFVWSYHLLPTSQCWNILYYSISVVYYESSFLLILVNYKRRFVLCNASKFMNCFSLWRRTPSYFVSSKTHCIIWDINEYHLRKSTLEILYLNYM